MSDLHLVNFYQHNSAQMALASIGQAKTRCQQLAVSIIYLTVDITECSCRKCLDLATLDAMRASAAPLEITALQELESTIEKEGL